VLTVLPRMPLNRAKSDIEAQSKGEVKGSDGIFINPSIKGQRIRPGQIHPTDESRAAQVVHQEFFIFLDSTSQWRRVVSMS